MFLGNVCVLRKTPLIRGTFLLSPTHCPHSRISLPSQLLEPVGNLEFWNTMTGRIISRGTGHVFESVLSQRGAMQMVCTPITETSYLLRSQLGLP